jgi:cation-transporting P-type ATPase I
MLPGIGPLRALVPWGGRRHRRASLLGRLAHVEVRGMDGPGAAAVAEAVETALASEPWVVRAAANGALGRVVVEVDDGVELARVVRAVEAVEAGLDAGWERFPLDRPDHPADGAPVVREVVAAAADVAATGLAVLGRVARLTPVPVEVAGLASAVWSEPRVRNGLATLVGPTVTDVGLNLTNAAVQAVAQGPVGLVADLGHRLSLLAEARARRAGWARTQDDLCAPGREGAPPIPRTQRPDPLDQGPVESFTERAAVGALAAAGGTFLATGDVRRSAAAAIALTPKAARLGREAFAAHLGRVFADREIVCLDPSALRRLDRIDTVVLDAAALGTGLDAVTRVDIVGEGAPSEVRRWVREMFDPERPTRRAQRRGWSLRPVPARDRRQLDGELEAAEHVLALRRGEDLVALVGVSEGLSPQAFDLVAAARAAGAMVVVAGPPALSDRLGADLQVDGGDLLLASIGMLQQDGCGVALLSVAGAGDTALRSCEVGIGLVGAAVPWGAHLLVRDLASAALALDALAVAHDVSRQSAALALAGSAVGGVLALTSMPARSGARALASVNGAAIASLANGVRAAMALGARPARTVIEHPPWHELDVEEVLEQLETTTQGLPPDEASVRLGISATVEPGPISLPAAVLEELANPLTPVLAGAAALATAVGSLADAAIVGSVVGVNALVGGVQRYQVERAVRRLEVLSSQRVRVLRGGVVVAVPAADIVPGDVIALAAGDSVPADCRILEAVALEIDESSLTGESLPVPKTAEASLSPVVAERTSMIYDGTLVAAGEVTAVAVATGSDTEARRALAGRPPAEGGVESRLRDLTRVTVPIAGLAGAGIVGAGLLRARPIAPSLHAGVSLAVAAVPEGLPILATMAQLSAARRLSNRGALVRNPRAIEALGRVDLLCCDKTGTLTEGRILFRGVHDGRISLDLDVGGQGRDVLAAALRASPFDRPDKDPLPHLTDRAVVEGAARHGVVATAGLEGWRRRAELPFEPARGYHAVLGRNGGVFLLSVKGAPEVVVPRCSEWRHAGGVVALDDALRAELATNVENLARRGLRILAVAEREASSRRDLDDDRVDRLCLIGFVSLSDPVRPTAASAVSELAAAGVRTVMITGDHPSTAEGIAAELGLLNGHRVLTGPELEAMDDDALDAVLDDTSVFARVTPTHKVRIVGAYQRQGRAVAMTGDGANDAPAIRLADVGVALGEHSTSAARAAADVVVVDGRVETLIDAIVEGRAMWTSVREAIAVLIGGNLGEILFTVATSAVSDGTLGPRQLLLVNLLTDAAPALAIAMRPPKDKAPEDLLREGPEASLGVALERQIVSRAVATAAGAGVAWAGARVTGRATRASTVALVGLVGGQLGQTLAAGGRDPVVLAAALGSGVALAAIVQTPGLSQFFGCTPLGPVGWGLGLGGAAVATALATVTPAAVALVPRFADTTPDPSPAP